MKNYLVVSFYTEGFYEKVANSYLIPSLKEFNIPYYIEKLPSQKNWNHNTNLKPYFCLKMLEKFPDKKLVWIDADSRVVNDPEMFNLNYELGVVYISWKVWFNYRKNIENKKELISNVIMFKNTDIVKKIFVEWQKGTQNRPFVWEQKHLENAVDKYLSEINLLTLSEGYSYFDTLPNGTKPNVKIIPIIKQYQISRKTKRNPELL